MVLVLSVTQASARRLDPYLFSAWSWKDPSNPLKYNLHLFQTVKSISWLTQLTHRLRSMGHNLLQYE